MGRVKVLRKYLSWLVWFCLPQISAAQGFTHLSFQPGPDTTVHGWHFHLEEPDDPVRPRLWQGPITITHNTRRCVAAASLISDLYLSSTAKLLVVVSVSGSRTEVHFFRPEDCAQAFPPIMVSTEGVFIHGAKLTVLPLCECPGPNQPCSCNAGSVYRLRDDVAPARLESESNALNRSRLGVAFKGIKNIAHRPSPPSP